MTGGRGGLSDFLGSEILAKSDFFGSMKGARIFLGGKRKKKIFLGMLKKTVIFWEDKFSSCNFFGYKI